MEEKNIGGEGMDLPNETREVAEPAQQGEKQSRAENARAAAARRRRERDEAVEQATASLRAELHESRKRTSELEETVFRLRVQPDMARIHAYDPRVRGMEDLSRLSRAEQFYEEVKKGKGYLAAYETVYADCITRTASGETAAKPQEADGRAHLTPTRQRGNGAVCVPPDALQLYRALNPGLKDEDFRAHYDRCARENRKG